MSSTPLAVSPPRRSAPLRARARVAACVLGAPALIACGDNRYRNPLHVEGHSIEAHGVHHLDAATYIADHGLAAYLDDEVQPSIDILRADGFAPVAYAHPFGSHTRELDEAIAGRIRFARSISGKPKP
jgi:peptidoglycan/xylan/chitin deacetylase (PgdA/CDA1 family)